MFMGTTLFFLLKNNQIGFLSYYQQIILLYCGFILILISSFTISRDNVLKLFITYSNEKNHICQGLKLNAISESQAPSRKNFSKEFFFLCGKSTDFVDHSTTIAQLSKKQSVSLYLVLLAHETVDTRYNPIDIKNLLITSQEFSKGCHVSQIGKWGHARTLRQFINRTLRFNCTMYDVF